MKIRKLLLAALVTLCSNFTATAEENLNVNHNLNLSEDFVRNAEMRNFAYENENVNLVRNASLRNRTHESATLAKARNGASAYENENLNVYLNENENFLRGDCKPWDKKNWTWNHTNPGVKPYKFMDDMTFAGIPIFVAGWIAKSEKHGFKQQDKHSLVTNFKTGIDDYTQFFGPALTLGLKVGGLEGRSDWGRFLASTAMSYGIMAALVNSIKYTAKEMRPDGSTANSWPSGHTATAFVGATILHKEYGLTRSPWYSVAGYGVATATGVMRVLNNRHWVSDVLSGAGIGIMSTELAYALSDVFFKGKGLLRNNLSTGKSIIDNPSFFSISMGLGFGSRNMDFDMNKFTFDDGDNDKNFNLKFGTSTAVGVEGAYFFNKHVGVGGRVRVNSSPIKGWQGIVDKSERDFVNWIFADTDDELMNEMVYGNEDNPYPLINYNDESALKFTIDSDHLTEFAFDLGVYLNFPLSKRFALGTKFLVGRSVMQELNLSATTKGYKRDVELNDDFDLTGVYPRNEEYSTTWDYFTVGGNNTFKTGTGISLTYAYKDNFAWRIFLDYDYTRKTYTMTYNPGEFLLDATIVGGSPLRNVMSTYGYSESEIKETQSIKKDRNTFILGGSFTINF